MLEDIEAAVSQYDKESTAQQCEAVIHHLDTTIKYAREVMGRMHAILERRIAEEKSRELKQRPADFPPNQSIGAQ